MYCRNVYNCTRACELFLLLVNMNIREDVSVCANVRVARPVCDMRFMNYQSTPASVRAFTALCFQSVCKRHVFLN